MDEPIEERVKKLPKWAQQYIEGLNRKINRERDIFEEVELQESPMRFERGFLDERQVVYIPRDADIIISDHIGGGTVKIRLQQDHIYVQAYGKIAIEPLAANAFHVRASRVH